MLPWLAEYNGCRLLVSLRVAPGDEKKQSEVGKHTVHK